MLSLRTTKPRSLVWFFTCVHIYFISLFEPVGSDAHASIAQLKNLVVSEDEFIPLLENYVLSQDHPSPWMTAFLDEVKTHRLSEAAAGDADGFVGHPLNALHVVKRYALGWSEVFEGDLQLPAEFGTGFMQAGLFQLPHKNDYVATTASILRLQKVYKLNTDHLAAGVVRDVRGVPLTADGCFDFAKTAMNISQYGQAVQWYRKALALSGGTFSKLNVLKDLASALWQAQHYIESAAVYKEAFQLDPKDGELEAKMNEAHKHSESLKTEGYKPQVNITDWYPWVPDWKSNYESLCRGETMQTEYQGPLSCRYRRQKNTFLQYKEEIINNDPRISLIYEVLSDHEAEQIKSLSLPQLTRAQVGDPSKSYASDERVGKTAWLWDFSDGFVATLSKRVSQITGMDTTYREHLASSEPFQVVNYGVGGQYEPHVDYYETKEMLDHLPSYILGTGDRIVTFMFYLSDVAEGGATIFSRIKVRVPPVKNAAAFWYNMQRNGEYDKRTEHAGCPVLLGQKWVANKWIRCYNQMFTRPCGKEYTYNWGEDDNS